MIHDEHILFKELQLVDKILNEKGKELGLETDAESTTRVDLLIELMGFVSIPEVRTVRDLTAKKEAIGFNMWLQSLSKSGYPKNENGTMKDIWQLYDYWNDTVDKAPFYAHANFDKTIFKPLPMT